jgi:DNA-binding NarL/FixJ family response regulator
MSDSETLRVLIADDHQLIVEGLRIVLDEEDMEIVGVATNGRQAVEMTLELEPDILLLDIRMPDMDGIQALAQIKSARSDTSVIILTSFNNPEYLARAIALGAAGFLSKDSDPRQFPELLRAVADKEAIVDLELLQAAFKELQGKTHEDIVTPVAAPQLTPQEQRVLGLISEGLSNAAIADVLSVSINTVKSHVYNILRKLGVSDRTQAAIWAMRNGIIPS